MAIGCSIVRGAFLRIVSSTPCSIGLPQVDATISPDFLVSLRTVHSGVRAAKHVTGHEPVGNAIHESLASGFLPCLSGHALRVNTGARRLGVALLLCPSGLGPSPSGAPSKKARLGTWEPAPLAPGFANG